MDLLMGEGKRVRARAMQRRPAAVLREILDLGQQVLLEPHRRLRSPVPIGDHHHGEVVRFYAAVVLSEDVLSLEGDRVLAGEHFSWVGGRQVSPGIELSLSRLAAIGFA